MTTEKPSLDAIPGENTTAYAVRLKGMLGQHGEETDQKIVNILETMLFHGTANKLATAMFNAIEEDQP